MYVCTGEHETVPEGARERSCELRVESGRKRERGQRKGPWRKESHCSLVVQHMRMMDNDGHCTMTMSQCHARHGHARYGFDMDSTFNIIYNAVHSACSESEKGDSTVGKVQCRASESIVCLD